jgi:hypothetical protein
MALLLVLFAAVRWRYLDGLSNDVNREAAAAFFDILGRYLRAAIRLIALLGLLVAGVALATGRERSVPWPRIAVKRQPAEDGGSEQTWGDRNRVAWLGGILAATCLFVITPEHISQDWWRLTLVVALGGVILIFLAPRFGEPHTAMPAGPTGPAPGPPTPLSTITAKHDGDGIGGAAVGPGSETAIMPMQDLSASDRELLQRVAEALRGTG